MRIIESIFANSITELLKRISEINLAKNNLMGIAKVMAANAGVLIILGIYGYFVSGSPTSLIATAIGVVLFLISLPAKNDNKTAAHIGVGLTLVSAIMFIVIGLKRSNLIILVMAIFTILALVFYVMDFMKRKKERESVK